MEKFNDQQETNLHNVSSWFDQKPRILMEIGMVVGGLILPWLMRVRAEKIPAFIKQVCPDPKMGMVAVCYLVVKISDEIAQIMDYQLYYRVSEIIEVYIYYFILLYILRFDSTPFVRKRT